MERKVDDQLLDDDDEEMEDDLVIRVDATEEEV